VDEQQKIAFDYCQKKLIPIDAALDTIQSGQTIVTAMAACEPRQFFKGIAERAKNLEYLRVYCANPGEDYNCFNDAALAGRLELIVMFLTSHVHKRHGHGVVQYFPHHLSRWVKALTMERQVDVFWGTCSLPDSRGYVSLGLSASYEPEILKVAKTVILEVNPNMPVTYGATTVPLSQVDHFVLTERDIPVIAATEPNKDDLVIGQYVGDLIEDGSTIQLGIGHIPQAVGGALEGKRDLGVHTEMFNDAMMSLYEKGVITGRKKTIWPGKMVGAFALGSRQLYQFLQENPLIEFQPASVVNDPYRIGKNYKMVSVNSAVEIDLTGQCCSESIGHTELSGIGGAADTHVGAQRSNGGRGIVALRSTAAGGKQSKIVFELKPGAKVSISRNDIDTVVTEYGVARLAGKSVSERVRAMVALAHPDFRDELLSRSRACGYL